MKKLVIVESPIKSKTIEGHLKSLNQNDFFIVGTGGHVTNLPSDNRNVERNEDGKFIANFKLDEAKKPTINYIKSLLTKCEEVFICTDDDREGERIAEDIVEICKIKKYFRITFNEITKEAIHKALVEKEGVRLIDENIVIAQWTRRILDRVIGYGVSPVINKFFKDLKQKRANINFNANGTGRVEALALNILCQQQQLINDYENMKAESKLTDVIIANYTVNNITFTARAKNLQFKKDNMTERDSVIADLGYSIHRVYSRNREVEPKSPPHPLRTIDLYTACSQLYSLTPVQTYKYAKKIYELGYINYPRTDSKNLSETACNKFVEYLLQLSKENALQQNQTSKNDEFDSFSTITEDIILTKPRIYKQKTANTQLAHEAIRPTHIDSEHSPRNIQKVWAKNPLAKDLDNFHFLVYKLIWIRAMCSQLQDSEYDTSRIEIKAGDYTFMARSNDRIKDGWESITDENLIIESTFGVGEEDWKNKRVVIPEDLYINKIIEDVDVTFYESKGKAPKRITEGGLITKLTSLGVGRPSTIHTFSEKLIEKGYAIRLTTILSPTELGMEVNGFTREYLSWMLDEDEAKNFDEKIVEIENGKNNNIDGLIQIYWDKIQNFRKELNYPLM